MLSEDNSRFGVTISKQELSTLPIFRYEGNVVTIEDTAQVDNAIAALRQSDIIGFDTETKPTFKKGQLHNVALIQLCTRDCCYLFRICKIGIPDALVSLLEDPTVKKIGLSIHDDFHNLNRLRNFIPGGFVDLQSYVKQYKIKDNSLSRIFGILFGMRISKGQQLSNWEAPSLSPSQEHYAALDAHACIRIFDYISSGAFSPQDSPYYREPLSSSPGMQQQNS